MSNHEKTQQFRLHAIEAELAAVGLQARALGQIAIEHNCGVDIGCNAAVEHFADAANDLVASAKIIVANLPSSKDADQVALVSGFEKRANALKTEVKQLLRAHEQGAQRHLIDALEDTPKKQTYRDAAIVPNTALELKMQAHLHCHAAELGAVQSFVELVGALCDLSMEWVCVGAETAAE
jgi:hypothetical protein